jgi:hypothetical protein
MSTGDANDMLARLRATLPPWFPDDAPITNGVLAGLAGGLSFGYSLIQFAKAQTRIATMSGGWLDMAAWDFFGARFMRRRGEADASFKPRVLLELLRPRQTRAAISQALVDLTGAAPAIFEPWNPGDCGAYGYAMGYGCAGCYGSLALRNQIFVTAVLADGPGIPNVGGYGVGMIGYGVAGEYVDLSQVTGPITNEEIYSVVAQTVAAGVTAWVDIVPKLPAHVFTGFEYPITADGSLPLSDSSIVTVDHI